MGGAGIIAHDQGGLLEEGGQLGEGCAAGETENGGSGSVCNFIDHSVFII